MNKDQLTFPEAEKYTHIQWEVSTLGSFCNVVSGETVKSIC